MKNFWKLTRLEGTRVVRNKFILVMLIVFPILMLGLVAFTNLPTSPLPVAVYVTSQTTEAESVLDEMFRQVENVQIVEVETAQDGKDMVMKSKAVLFIEIDSSSTPLQAKVYYNSSSPISGEAKDDVQEESGQYAYETLAGHLKDIGITIKDEYFQLVTFSQLNAGNVTAAQIPFWLECACCIAIILCFGLTYSISRDNETNVSSNLKFMPIGINRFLWSKILPYMCLGFLEFLVLFAMGAVAFGIEFQGSALLMLLTGAVFVVATVMLGFLCSLLKNQISTIFLDMVCIILPIFVLSSGLIQAYPALLQGVFYLMPISAFAQCANALTFNGVMLWEMLAILAAQCVVYYVAILFALKKKIYS